MTIRDLVPRHVAEAVQAHGAKLKAGTAPTYCPLIEYGTPSLRSPQRRATCRVCGGPVARGEEAVTFAYDFAGCGSWTTVPCFAHIECPRKEAV